MLAQTDYVPSLSQQFFDYQANEVIQMMGRAKRHGAHLVPKDSTEGIIQLIVNQLKEDRMKLRRSLMKNKKTDQKPMPYYGSVKKSPSDWGQSFYIPQGYHPVETSEGKSVGMIMTKPTKEQTEKEKTFTMKLGMSNEQLNHAKKIDEYFSGAYADMTKSVAESQKISTKAGGVDVQLMNPKKVQSIQLGTTDSPVMIKSGPKGKYIAHEHGVIQTVTPILYTATGSWHPSKEIESIFFTVPLPEFFSIKEHRLANEYNLTMILNHETNMIGIRMVMDRRLADGLEIVEI